MTRKKSIEFHVKHGDYFGTLATILGLLSEPSTVFNLGGKKASEMLEGLRDDLVYLQKNYRIVHNTPNARSSPREKA